MEFRAKDRKKRLQPGVHLVTIKDVYIAREKGGAELPLAFSDPKTGEEYGAIEIVFMDHTQTGIIEKFLLGSRQIWVLNKLLKSIDALPAQGEQIDKELIVGKKVWIVIARCLVYENQIVRIDKDTNLPMWFPKMIPDFFHASSERPMLAGNPQDNGGAVGPQFTMHQDSKLGMFDPTPSYISTNDLPREGFGIY